MGMFSRRASCCYACIAILVVLFTALATPTVHASTPIVFDAANSTNCNPHGTPCPAVAPITLAWSHTVGSGSFPILVVGVSDGLVPDLVTPGSFAVSSVTYGSSSLTFIGAQNSVLNYLRVEMWYLLNPPIGTATITVTFSAAVDFAVGGSASYFNVGGVGAFNSANSGTPISVTVNSNSGALVVDTIVSTLGAASPGAGQTQRWNSGLIDPVGTLTKEVGAGSDKPASSPVTMTWAGAGTLMISNIQPEWAIIAVALDPFVAHAVHQVPVGGEMLPINLVLVLAPWVAALLILTVIPIQTLMRRRRN